MVGIKDRSDRWRQGSESIFQLGALTVEVTLSTVIYGSTGTDSKKCGTSAAYFVCF